MADDTPPVITCEDPSPFSVGPSNDIAFVKWNKPTCVDNADQSPTLACDGNPGERGIGVYTIPCTCTDDGNNSASCNITAVVEGK